jgi:hypothetical protein
MGDHFKVFGELDPASRDNLQKSLWGILATEEYLARGRVLNAVEDAQGETPIDAEIHWSFLDQAGFVRYEREPAEVVANGCKVVTKSIPRKAVTSQTFT